MQSVEHTQDHSNELKTSNQSHITTSVQGSIPDLEHFGPDLERKSIGGHEMEITDNGEAARSEIAAKIVDQPLGPFVDSDSAKDQDSASKGNVSNGDGIKTVKLESFADAVPATQKFEEKSLDVESKRDKVLEESPIIKPLDNDASLDSIFSSNSGNQTNKNSSPFLISGSLEGGSNVTVVCLQENHVSLLFCFFQ